MSWEQLSNNNRKIVTNHQDEKFNYLVYRVFGENEDGKQLLELLKVKYLLRPVCDPNLPSSHGYFREGENNIIRQLERCMQMYKHSINQPNKEG